MKSIRLSLAITAITQFASLAMTMGTMVVVSRLLTPQEIGIFSVSVSVIAFGHVFRDFGIGQYLVQAHEVTRDRLRLAFTVMLSISWTIALLLYVLRHPISAFYEHEPVADVMSVLALSFVILPFGAPLLSLLRREMKFGQIGVVTLSGQLVQMVVTIVLAFTGASFMSMAWGSVAGNLATVIILMLLRPGDAFLRPQFRGIKEILHFGTKSSTAALVGEFGSSAPDLIMGRTLGFADVAMYSRASGLTSMVTNQLVNVVRGVYFPAFAQSVRDGADPAWIFASTAARLTGIIVPFLALLALLSEPLITFLFGGQWERAASLATIVCIYTILTSPFILADVTLVACGRVGLLMRIQIKMQLIRVVAIMTSLYWQLEMVVLALAVAQLFQGVILMRVLREAIDLSPSRLWREVRCSFLLIPGSLFGPALLVAANWFFALEMPHFWLLAASGILAFAGWLGSIFLVRHPLLAEVENAWGKMRRGRS